MTAGSPSTSDDLPHNLRMGHFAEALLNPEQQAPKGVGREGRPAPRRFAVYRNNVVVGLIEAMKQAYPSLIAIMGEENFSKVARHFISAHPPQSAMMQTYGGPFAEFLKSYKPLAKSPFLADIARAERAWLSAYHAVDWPALTPEELASAGNPSELSFQPHPAACLLRSNYPLFDLFNARDAWPCPGIDLGETQAVLITRPELDCMITRLDGTDTAFFAALFEGQSLESAITSAMEAGDGFEPAGAIGLAFATGAFCSPEHPFSQTRNPPA